MQKPSLMPNMAAQAAPAMTSTYFVIGFKLLVSSAVGFDLQRAIQRSHLLVDWRRLRCLMTEAMYTTVTKQGWVGSIEGRRHREWIDEDFVNLIVSVDRLPFDLEW